VLRDALAVGAATGAYGLSFGAIATAMGLSVPQTATLSAVMFTGASQFALVGVLGAGGAPLAAAATATLLGSRNALYGLRLSAVLRVRGPGRSWRRGDDGGIEWIDPNGVRWDPEPIRYLMPEVPGSEVSESDVSVAKAPEPPAAQPEAFSGDPPF
jgi:AzlC protein